VACDAIQLYWGDIKVSKEHVTSIFRIKLSMVKKRLVNKQVARKVLAKSLQRGAGEAAELGVKQSFREGNRNEKYRPVIMISTHES
jgi:hypothetical protein